MDLNPVSVTSNSDITPVSSKEFLDIQATTEFIFTLKRVSDMTRRQSLIHQLSSNMMFHPIPEVKSFMKINI